MTLARAVEDYCITQEELKRRFHYDPETGVFTHLISHRKGTRLGHIKQGPRSGYRVWHVEYPEPSGRRGKRSYVYKLHRLAFIYMTGQCDPNLVVDHINHDRDDNRWCNLRLVSQQKNSQNCRLKAA